MSISPSWKTPSNLSWKLSITFPTRKLKLSTRALNNLISWKHLRNRTRKLSTICSDLSTLRSSRRRWFRSRELRRKNRARLLELQGMMPTTAQSCPGTSFTLYTKKTWLQRTGRRSWRQRRKISPRRVWESLFTKRKGPRKLTTCDWRARWKTLILVKSFHTSLTLKWNIKAWSRSGRYWKDCPTEDRSSTWDLDWVLCPTGTICSWLTRLKVHSAVTLSRL